MKLTDRDIELLKWVNGFGFVTSGHVAMWMGVSDRVANRRLGKLESEDLIKRERLFLRGGALVRVTTKGVARVSDDVRALNKICMGSFEHDRQLVDLALKAEVEHSGSVFVPERRIRHELGLKGVGQVGHIADGYLLADGQQIAIELELTKKHQQRLKKILNGFKANFKISSVWYFCAPDVLDYVSAAVGSDELFQLYKWEVSDGFAK